MKEAYGGIFSITAVLVVLIIVLSIMAFAVNYSKAFRVKNEIRSIIEKNNGFTDSAAEQIGEVIDKYQYYSSNSQDYQRKCKNLGYQTYDNGKSQFCIKCTYADNVGQSNKNLFDGKKRGAYYSIVAFVNVDVPLINNIFEFSSVFFRVSGETAIIYAENNNDICIKSVVEN